MPPQTQDVVINQNDKKLPDWIKTDVFEELLKQQVNGFKAIKSLRASAGAAAGENYATIMFRIEFDVELNDETQISKAFMLKAPHETEIYQKLLQNHNFFDIERGMYIEVVPELEELYRNAGQEIKFGAECYDINVKDHYVLLEDLRPRGFRNVDRLKGLDQTHTESVLLKLAQWHAASAVRVASKGAYDKKFTKGFFRDPEVLRVLCTRNLQSLLNYIHLYKGHEQYLNELQNITPKLLEVVMEMSEPHEDEFNALNHGDAWSNNIMFQYNEKNELINTYLVDLQIPKWGSVAQDLLYFLLSSTELDIKISKFEYFISFYHKELVKQLTLLKYTKTLPTLKSIHHSLYKYGGWGLFAILNVMGVVLLDADPNANFESFFEDDAERKSNFKKSIFTNPRYRKHMEILLPWLQYRGALE
ncbi:uncharacterized protein [Drosophila tropicalis]|uniref:uncharacterized protein n=1 Tax=Drosophila tropicalis TaxID=46794 RepID=UPI0035ABFE4C